MIQDNQSLLFLDRVGFPLEHPPPAAMFVSLPISLLIKHCYVTEALVTYLLLGLLNGGAAVSLCESEL